MKKQAAIELGKAGFAVLPCYDVSKGHCACGRTDCPSPGKHPLNKDGSKGASSDVNQIGAWWDKWPDANVAVATGRASSVFVLDIDRKDDRDGFLWLDAMEGIEDPLTGPRALTPSGGIHLFFTYPESGKVRQSSDSLCRGVDVRSDNGYVVVAPSNHVNGGVYEWEDSILEHPHEQAPQWLLDRVTGEASTARQDGRRWRVSTEMADEDRGELRDALHFVDADDRQTWLLVGMAIHSKFANQEGLTVWDEWSRLSDKYDRRTQLSTWDNFDSHGGVGTGTIFHLAKDGGWREPKTINPDEVVPYVAPDLAEPLPTSLIYPPGLLGDVVRWIVESALYPRPRLALAAALSLLGVIYGRRYASETNARTNLFCIGVAASGSGKDHAIGCVSSLLMAACPGEKLEGGGDYTSGAAVFRSLHRSDDTRQIVQLDEFGRMLQAVSRRGANAKADIPSALMRIFSASNRVIHGTEYSKEERIDLVQPHLNVHGTTTPESFFESLTSNEMIDGFLNRMLVFAEPAGIPAENMKATGNRPPERLVEAVREAHDIASSLRKGLSSAPHTVPYRTGAKGVLHDFGDSILPSREGVLGALWARSKEQAIKLALIRAIGQSPVTPMIGVEDMRWGCDVVTCLTSYIAHQCDERISDSDYQADLKRVLVVVRQQPNGIRRHALTRKLQRISKDMRQKILDDLSDSGDVEARKEGNGITYYPTRIRE